ncbi:unnamed protein product [Paramecium sonneborni]|uniref:Uncharacterized protein n=1 Tax=Paramecium sonneborni TaxID=65129 RepID=A0A8S1KYZ1_9CILI|nr:unnamed protein product [Paramecium sonneborni]
MLLKIFYQHTNNQMKKSHRHKKRVQKKVPDYLTKIKSSIKDKNKIIRKYANQQTKEMDKQKYLILRRNSITKIGLKKIRIYK